MAIITKRFCYLVLLMSVAIVLTISMAKAEKRVALVIGNSTYELAGTLLNPLNDATDMAASLEELGFEVVLGTDLKYSSMRATLKQFSARLVGADVALFFYAGHAVQVKGVNYLAPIDTDIARESDLEFETVALDVVQKLMEREAKTQLVFLDSCRNNPLTRQLLSRTRGVETGSGLARQPLSVEGSYIAFATQPGNVALDGTGRNSPFTSALLKNLKRPGVEISTLMTDVRRDVYESTGKQQLPWTNSGLLGRFYFAPQANLPVKQSEPENAAWVAVKESNDPKIIRKFIAEFPDSVLTSLAQFKLDQLELATPQKTELQQQDEKNKRLELLDQQRLASLQGEESETQIKTEPEVTAPQRLVTRHIIRSIQTDLNRLGCSSGNPDGVWGRKSITALSNYSKHANKRFASTQPTIELYDDLRTRDERVCPVVTTVKKKSKKVRRTTNNTRINKRKTVKKPSRSRNCFQFNGKTVCE